MTAYAVGDYVLVLAGMNRTAIPARVTQADDGRTIGIETPTGIRVHISLRQVTGQSNREEFEQAGQRRGTAGDR